MLLNKNISVPEGSITESVDWILPRHPDPWHVDFPSIQTIQPIQDAKARKLKICIATEDIVGPIRNGGIGTTFTHLAFLLAETGHDTTILYLRGGHSESGDINRWVEWYRERGVKFIPVDIPGNIYSAARRWIKPMYALYQVLRNEHYDLVHVSEWRGSAYLSLLAKKQGLAFKNTVFCVKTSSPWLWNREGRMRTVSQLSNLVKMYAERRSVELADLVIGGSAYLLRWMLDHGYQLPPGRTFVQPNVLKPVELPEDLRANRPAYGSRVPVKEIVFFGRLEHRKGLDLFCEAIHSLLKEGCKLPPVTFMGKLSAGIPGYPDLTTEQYIHEQARNWPMAWKILSNYNQHEALTYLHGEGLLAVMPSVAENSTLTVYETTHFAIPFIATDVGGTSELIAREHCAAVLVDAHPVPIAGKLREVLDEGGFVAAPAFDNAANLEVWNNFHSNMSTILDNEGWPPKELECGVRNKAQQEIGVIPSTSVCVVLKDDPERLAPTIDILFNQSGNDFEVILVDDGSESEAAQDWLRKVEQKAKENERKWKIFRQPHFGLPAARNFAAGEAEGDYLLFIDPDSHPHIDAIEVLQKVARKCSTDVLLPFYKIMSREEYNGVTDKGKLMIFLTGDPAISFYRPRWRSPAVYIRKTTFEEVGGFHTDYKIPGSMEEFVVEAILAGKRVESVPECLVDQIFDYQESEGYDENAVHYRTIRPYLRSAPLCFQSILMMARGAETNKRVLQKQFDKILKEHEKYSKIRLFLKYILNNAESRSPRVFKPLFWFIRILIAIRRRLRRWLKERVSSS